MTCFCTLATDLLTSDRLDSGVRAGGITESEDDEGKVNEKEEVNPGNNEEDKGGPIDFKIIGEDAEEPTANGYEDHYLNNYPNPGHVSPTLHSKMV